MDQARINRAAARAHGVLLPGVLDAEGVTLRQRQRRVSNGEWRRLPNGVLVVAAVPVTFEMTATAALAAAPGSVLSHQSAASLLGSSVGTHPIHVTIDPGRRTRLAGAVLHQSPLDRRDVTTRRGFRVTTIERTLVDLGATIGRTELQRCFEDQLVQRRTTFERIETTFNRLARPGRDGIARTRWVIELLDGQPPNESELEAMFHRLLSAAEIASPDRQTTFDWSPREIGRVDGSYPDEKVIVELDGRRYHARLEAFERDRRRDQIALTHGFRTLRFTHQQLTREPAWVAAVLTVVLAL